MKYLSNFAKTSATICLSSIDLSLLGPNFSNNANTTWSCFIPNPLHNTFTTSALVVEESMVILQVAKQISSKKNLYNTVRNGYLPAFSKVRRGYLPDFSNNPFIFDSLLKNLWSPFPISPWIRQCGFFGCTMFLTLVYG